VPAIALLAVKRIVLNTQNVSSIPAFAVFGKTLFVIVTVSFEIQLLSALAIDQTN
jgi:hypothetical protein